MPLFGLAAQAPITNPTSTLIICYRVSFADFLGATVVPILGAVLLIGAFFVGRRSRRSEIVAAWLLFVPVLGLTATWSSLLHLSDAMEVLASSANATFGEIAGVAVDMLAPILSSLAWTTPTFAVVAIRWFRLKQSQP
jgi:hypothetical protein